MSDKARVWLSGRNSGAGLRCRTRVSSQSDSVGTTSQCRVPDFCYTWQKSNFWLLDNRNIALCIMKFPRCAQNEVVFVLEWAKWLHIFPCNSLLFLLQEWRTNPVNKSKISGGYWCRDIPVSLVLLYQSTRDWEIEKGQTFVSHMLELGSPLWPGATSCVIYPRAEGISGWERNSKLIFFSGTARWSPLPR